MSKQYYISENTNEGRFEDPETIYDSTFEMDFESDHMERDGMPVISNGHIARGFFPEQPMMVVAATGSGKTRRLIIPYLISCIKSDCNMFINDPKGELYKHTKKMLKKAGYKTLVIDLRNLDHGERFNPCEYPAKLYKSGKKGRADEILQAMFDTFMNSVRSEKDPYWHTTGSQYITGLAELCCDLFPTDMVTINNIYNLHIQGNKRMGSSNFLKAYMEKHEDKEYYKLMASYINAPNETKASLDSVVTSGFSKYCRNEDVIDLTSNSTFDITDMVEKKTALFIISRDESSVYNALITAIVDEIYEVVIDLAEERYNGTLPRRLTFILDEFGNLAPIDDINSKITVSRSRNVGWCLCCQSLDQLKLKYTADVAKIILGNCNIAYMYSSDLELLKMISDLCGKTVDEYTHESRPLLSVEKLRSFDKKEGQTLFLLDRKKPFIGFLPDISEYNVIPETKTEFKKRKRQVLKKVDFETIVKQERSEQIGREGKTPFGIPTFEEFMASRREEAERKAGNRPAMHLDDILPWEDEEEIKNNSRNTNKSDEIQDLIDRIDRKIEELEKEEKKKEKFRSIEIKRMISFEKTAAAISKCLGVPAEMGNNWLRNSLNKGHRTIENVPKAVAASLVEEFKRIGTLAVIVGEN